MSWANNISLSFVYRAWAKQSKSTNCLKSSDHHTTRRSPRNGKSCSLSALSSLYYQQVAVSLREYSKSWGWPSAWGCLPCWQSCWCWYVVVKPKNNSDALGLLLARFRQGRWFSKQQTKNTNPKLENKDFRTEVTNRWHTRHI